jgi:lipopolysaccharide heptosyltransferase II
VYKNALIINPFGIGDVLFTTPIIHTLKDTFRNIKLGYLCNRRTAPILENNPHIDLLFIYERDEFVGIRKKSFISWVNKNLKFLDEIKRKKFDLVVDLSLNSQYEFFSWYAGIKTRIGYDYKGRGWLLTKKIKLEGYDNKHIVEYYADLLKLIDINIKYKKLELYLEQRDTSWAEEFLDEKKIDADGLLVAVIPGAGASWGKTAYLKHWSAENFARLSDKIIENYKAKIIIMGDLSEQKIANSILKCMHREAIDATGQTSLGQFAALLSKARLAITNDGGPLHIAVAMGIKAVAIFGPVDERVYGPYPKSDQQIVVKKGIDCQPCYRRFRMPICQKNRECLTTITVEDAYSAVERLLR